MEELSATGHVRGTDPDPYNVKLQVTPTGFASECSCPAFPKINGHCKHVAALLISLRDQVRPKQPRQEQPPRENASSSREMMGGGRCEMMGMHGGGGLGDIDGLGGGSRRARRRARKLAAQRGGGGGGGMGGMGGIQGGGRPGFTIGGDRSDAHGGANPNA